MLAEEPPYLTTGTEVSAKYKGAFCEAKIRKVERLVKCKIAFKLGYGSHTIIDSHVKGPLRVGAAVEAKHPEKKEYVEGTVTKILDCSQYTVVFDDGDITTLRRSALCPKSGRHFAESETLDQLPLTHPEHFGNPVFGKRGSRKRLESDDSPDDQSPQPVKQKEQRESEIGKVVCVELGDKKKAKDNWFPGLVVSPAVQDTVKIQVKEEYLVRSFKDARYYTVPKKEATEFTKEIGAKVENNTLKAAVEKALIYLDKDELPPHWDREQLFCDDDSDDSNSDDDDSDTSDDEPREEKDHFVAQLYKFMDDRGTPINVCPTVCSRDLDLYKLFKVVHKMNGYNRVSNNGHWKSVASKLGFVNSPGIVTQVKHAYKRYLHSFEDFYRKLGCTMVNHPRNGRPRIQRGRSLIRDKDKTIPIKTVSQPEPSTSKLKRDVDDITGESSSESKNYMTEEISAENKVNIPAEKPEVRGGTSSKKKFPTLKVSPRTKSDIASKRRGQPRIMLTRPNLTGSAMRQNSTEDAPTSSDESNKTHQTTDGQGASTRAKVKEDVSKQASQKDDPLRGKSSSKSSDADVTKKVKTGEGQKSRKVVNEENSNKRNRKRRNTASEESVTSRQCIPRNKSIAVGDILKVYYGTSKDPNGIYEAKVMEIDEDMFLVHYAGWNSRYDEWIKRDKIAENITGSTRRKKANPVKAPKSGSKRKAASKSEPARSSTPSSITSSSSVSKSPATPASRRRSARANVGAASVSARRGRPISATENSPESDTDSESHPDSASDSETNLSAKSSRRIPVSNKRRSQQFRQSASLEEAADVTEKKKPRLIKKEANNDQQDAGVKKDEEELKIISLEESSDSRKGRDFDLNEIRSELKGIEKAVKVTNEDEETFTVSQLPDERVEDVEEGEITDFVVLASSQAADEDTDVEQPKSPLSDKEEQVTLMREEDDKGPVESVEDEDEKMEDIYEFKEPEPFEFQEVRRTIRIFDEVVEKPSENNPTIQSSSVVTIDKKESSSDDVKFSKVGRVSSCNDEKPVVYTNDEKKIKSERDESDVEDCPPPQLVPCPPTVSVETIKDEVKGVTETHKQSPEPPCLEPVTKEEPEQSDYVISCDQPPNITTETSCSDSESEERLVIANDDEPCWKETSAATASVISSPQSYHENDAEDEKEREVTNFLECVSEMKSPNDGATALSSLVCDEVIPGSPTAKDINDELDLAQSTRVASLMENTPPTSPPTTPHSPISSHQEDREAKTYQDLSADNEKSRRDSLEVEQNDGQKSSFKLMKRVEKDTESQVIRRKYRRRSESGCEGAKRFGRGRRREVRGDAAGSDSDLSEPSSSRQGSSLTSTFIRPAKYNFIKELDPSWDSNQRIAFLQNQIQELRKAYMHLKNQTALLDRRRKKLRRKEREARAAALAANAATVANSVSSAITPTMLKTMEISNP